jgi:predicted DNA-binding transcriptional regulator YafY
LAPDIQKARNGGAMKKSSRLIYVINLIRNNRNLNASKLAKLCNVTQRTIYRDIAELSEANVPVYYDRGYKLASDIFMPPLNFEIDEFVAVRAALESRTLSENSPFSSALRRAREKVVVAMNGRIPSQIKSKPMRLHVQETSTDVITPHVTKVFSVLEESIDRSESVRINYRALSGDESSRIIEPYNIVFRRHGFYLIAYCRKRGDFRTFRIMRIRSAESIGQRFVRDGRFTVDEYFDGAWEVFTGEPVEVSVRFNGIASNVVEGAEHHSQEQKRRLDSGELLYEITVAGTKEIEIWLRQFGKEAVVDKPVSLKESLARFYTEAARSYGDASSL